MQADLKVNKIKEGSLLHQQDKKWKESWIILTKTSLYTFENKNQYDKASQTIALKDIVTIKCYYKGQYQKPHSFRVQTSKVNVYLSPKSSEQKLEWISAIETSIDKVMYPTIRKQQCSPSKELRITPCKTAHINITPQQCESPRKQLIHKEIQQEVIKEKIEEQQTNFKDQQNILNLQKLQYQQQQTQTEAVQQQSKTKEVYQQDHMKAAQQQHHQETVQQQDHSEAVFKIRKQEIQQIPKQKVKEKQHKVNNQLITTNISNSSLAGALKALMLSQENHAPEVIFAVSLFTSPFEQYKPQIEQFIFDSESQRYFSQCFLSLMNQQNDEQELSKYLKFILTVYSQKSQFFYTSDLKTLIDIFIRQIESNRSKLNSGLILQVLKAMAQNQWWKDLDYRRKQIRSLVQQVQMHSQSSDSKIYSSLLELL